MSQNPTTKTQEEDWQDSGPPHASPPPSPHVSPPPSPKPATTLASGGKQVKVEKPVQDVEDALVGEGARASLFLQDHVKIDYDEDFELPEEEEVKIHWNMRRTAERPCTCCCQLCGCWVFLIIILIILMAAVASIEFSLGVPFYDRDEINQRREDAYAATVEGADFLGSLGSITGQCVHDDPTVLTRNGTLVQGPAPTGSCQRSSTMAFRLLFISKDRETNILTPENLMKIKEIEDRIINHVEWPRYCYLIDSSVDPLTTRDEDTIEAILEDAAGKEPEFTPCERIRSFTNLLDPLYFDEATGIGYHLMPGDQFPQEFDYSQENLDEVVDFWSTYTPRSYNLSGIDFALTTVGAQVIVPNYMWQLTSGDYDFGSTEAIGITSVLNLGLPINDYASATEAASDQYEDIGTWLWEEFDSFLKNADFDGVDVYWSDNENGMLDAESGDLAMKSFALFPLSVIGVMIYLIIMQDSCFIGLAGIMQIMLSFIPTIILYRYVFQVEYLGVCELLAAFLLDS